MDKIAEFSKRTGRVKEFVMDSNECDPETQTEIVDFTLGFVAGHDNQHGVEDLYLANHTGRSLTTYETEKICTALRSNKTSRCPLKTFEISDRFGNRGTFERKIGRAHV